MPVRSKRLGVSNNPGGVEQVVYTCPQDETAIIKDVRIAAETAVERCVVVLQSSGGVRVPVLDGPLPAVAVRSSTGFICLKPGDSLRFYAQGAAAVIWVSGAELEGLAD